MSRETMFAYWGRHGALTQLTLELAETLESCGESENTSVSISASNELIVQYRHLGPLIFPIHTFRNSVSALNPFKLWRFRNALVDKFRIDNTQALVSLMPHVWTPLVNSLSQRMGIRHTIVVHDSSPHSGDPTASVNPWLIRSIRNANHIVALSEHVAKEVRDLHRVPSTKVSVLSHPDLAYGAQIRAQKPHGGPLRLLFFGRILPYKDLGLFLDALSLLQDEGFPFEASVFGEGDTRRQQKHMQQLGIRRHNEWISSGSIADIFAQHDVVVLTHRAASQSGVVATAFGSGLPVVTVPVGGLIEQIDHGITGLITENRTANAVADAIRRLVDEPRLLQNLRDGIARLKPQRSMQTFLKSISDVARDCRTDSPSPFVIEPATNAPSVSVVIPAYNSAATIGRAVSSALTQGLPPKEVIVVDDGSSDDLANALSSFGDRLRVIRHLTNKGASAARNTGIKAAAGQFIAFLDSDDAWTSYKLARQVPFMKTHDLDASCTAFEICSGKKGRRHIAFRPYRELLSVEDFAWGCYTSPGSTLIASRDSLLKSGGYDTQFQRYEDWDLMLRLSESSQFRIGFLNHPLATIYLERKVGSDSWFGALELLTEKHEDLMKDRHETLLRKFRSGVCFNRASAFAGQKAWKRMSKELYKSLAFVPIGNWPMRVILAERLRTLPREL